jgi:hypothetical protein
MPERGGADHRQQRQPGEEATARHRRCRRLTQVPGTALHVSSGWLQGMLQQTPSTQNVELHSLPDMHPAPSGCGVGVVAVAVAVGVEVTAPARSSRAATSAVRNRASAMPVCERFAIVRFQWSTRGGYHAAP